MDLVHVATKPTTPSLSPQQKKEIGIFFFRSIAGEGVWRIGNRDFVGNFREFAGIFNLPLSQWFFPVFPPNSRFSRKFPMNSRFFNPQILSSAMDLREKIPISRCCMYPPPPSSDAPPFQRPMAAPDRRTTPQRSRTQILSRKCFVSGQHHRRPGCQQISVRHGQDRGHQGRLGAPWERLPPCAGAVAPHPPQPPLRAAWGALCRCEGDEGAGGAGGAPGRGLRRVDRPPDQP